MTGVTNGGGAAITDAANVANVNPIRYRGYYYDTDTSLYYCQSRYYDPEVGRWINADGYMSTGQGIIGWNMFSYCNNSPIQFADFSGALPDDRLLANARAYKNGHYFAMIGGYYDASKHIDNVVVFGGSSAGMPNSKSEWYDESGNLTKERWYGSDGRPTKDRHHTNHGNSKKHPVVPHDHDWGYDENGNWVPGHWHEPTEATTQDQLVTGLAEVGATAITAYGIYLGIKWVIAGISAIPTGGTSLVVAGLTP